MKKGQRIKLSEKWLIMYHTHKDKEAAKRGVIVGESRDGNCWRVLFDGTKSVASYHKSFISLPQRKT